MLDVGCWTSLSQKSFDDVPMHIRQPEISALKLERHSLVIDAEAAEDCGVEVVDVDQVLDDVVAVVVGFAVDEAGLDAAAGHPQCEAAAVVVATVVVLGEDALAVDGSAELAAP